MFKVNRTLGVLKFLFFFVSEKNTYRSTICSLQTTLQTLIDLFLLKILVIDSFTIADD